MFEKPSKNIWIKLLKKAFFKDLSFWVVEFDLKVQEYIFLNC